jgi:hypothetical protein
MTKMRLQWALVILCLCAGVRGFGQSAVDGAIGGTVEDKTGSAIPRATVTIRSNATNTEQSVQADEQGFYRAIHLESGVYTVTVTVEGCRLVR